MFIMMNSARLSVGVQGVGLAELALQQASEWARSRVQGRPAGGKARCRPPPSSIIRMCAACC
jgi:alkylation response protein AidB-like acyl-CoA dehydrogenase